MPRHGLRDEYGRYAKNSWDAVQRHGYAIFRAFLVSVVCMAFIYTLARLTSYTVGLQAYLAAAVAGNLGSLIGQYQDHPKNAYRLLKKAFDR
jgi:hypothetical protein